MTNDKLFTEVLSINKTIRNISFAHAMFSLSLAGLILIFSNRQHACEIVVAGAIFLFIWTRIFTTRLRNKRKKLFKELHKSGLSYLEINQIIHKLENSRVD